MTNEDVWFIRMRRDLGLTQEDVATALGVTPRTVINWENGHHEPRLTVEQFIKLCELLGVTEISQLPRNPFAQNPVNLTH